MDNDWIATQATAYFCAAFLPLGALAVAAQGIWRATVISEGGDLASSEELNRLAPPLLVGLIERCLYLASWLEGRPEFIGVWLALKIAGGWKAWSEGLTIPSGKRSDADVVIPGRTLVNLFLVNSGLSVLHAIAVGKGLQLFMANAPRLAIEVAAAPYLLTTGIALYGYVRVSSARAGRGLGGLRHQQPGGSSMTHKRRLELLRAIKTGERSIGADPGDDAAFAKLQGRLREWEELEALGDLELKVMRETMSHESRVYKATAILTQQALEFLEAHADEFGGE